MKAIASIFESATAQHHMWVRSSRTPDGDRSIHEDECLARILDAAVCYDALIVANLACMELVCRRRQLLAEAHSQNPAAPSYSGAEHLLGQTYKAVGNFQPSTVRNWKLLRQCQTVGRLFGERCWGPAFTCTWPRSHECATGGQQHLHTD